MSFQKFRSESYCVGGRHRSAIVQFVTGKKSLTVGDNTIQAESFGDFSNLLVKRT